MLRYRGRETERGEKGEKVKKITESNSNAKM
jgi:hypothetical protein